MSTQGVRMSMRGIHACVHVCVWHETALRAASQKPTLVFEIEFLPGTWGSPVWIGCLASTTRGSSWLCLPGAEIQSMCHHT